jgi:hypothetical protein
VPDTWISPEMEAAVGREYGARTSFPISASDIRKWALALYYPERPPRLFWDEAYAATTSHGGIVAPEDFNPFAWLTADALDEDPTQVRPSQRSTGGGNWPEHSVGVAPPTMQNNLNGGMECTYGVRMRPGDVIRSVTSIAGYHERSGRLGLMLFTTTEQRWTNQEDQLVKAQRDILIRY